MKKVMVIAVHPDDESLGCGGTLLKHKKNGDSVCWTIMTSTKGNESFSEEYRENRKNEISQVKKKYDFDKTYELTMVSGKVEETPLLNRIQELSACINEFQPNILYIPFMYDVHSDHRYAFEAILACTKKFRYPFIEKVLMMEVVSETEFAPAVASQAFLPNVFSDITQEMTEKLEILKIYGEEMGEPPFPRSLQNVEALAQFRGAMSGCRYAESFMLLKEFF